MKRQSKRIMVLAIGSGGCNIAETIRTKASVEELREASFVFADRDKGHLSKFESGNNRIITLNKGCDYLPPSLFHNVERLFIVAGLGGKTSYEFLPEITGKALSIPIPNVSFVVTMPFSFEGEKVKERAKMTLSTIAELNGIRIDILENDVLVDRFPEINFFNAFNLSDTAALESIEKQITE